MKLELFDEEEIARETVDICVETSRNRCVTCTTFLHLTLRFRRILMAQVLGHSNWLRKACVYVITRRWFDVLVVAVIIISCIATAVDQPHVRALSYSFHSELCFSDIGAHRASTISGLLLLRGFLFLRNLHQIYRLWYLARGSSSSKKPMDPF